MPRGIDMRHDMDRPASRPRLVGSAAGVFRKRIEAAADTGIGAEQRDRPELPLGFLDHVLDVFLLPDIAFERRATDRGRNSLGSGTSRSATITFAAPARWKRLAQRAPNAIGRRR